jgi:hypothetical protein
MSSSVSDTDAIRQNASETSLILNLEGADFFTQGLDCLMQSANSQIEIANR